MKQLIDSFGIKNITAKIIAKFINKESKNSNNSITNNCYFNSPITIHINEISKKIKSKN